MDFSSTFATSCFAFLLCHLFVMCIIRCVLYVHIACVPRPSCTTQCACVRVSASVDVCTPLAAMPLIAYERWLNFSESLKERGFERERTLDRLRRKRKRPRLTLAPTANNAVDLACIDKSNNFRLKSAPFNQHAITNWAGVIYGTLTIMLCACNVL